MEYQFQTIKMLCDHYSMGMMRINQTFLHDLYIILILLRNKNRVLL